MLRNTVCARPRPELQVAPFLTPADRHRAFYVGRPARLEPQALPGRRLRHRHVQAEHDPADESRAAW